MTVNEANEKIVEEKLNGWGKDRNNFFIPEDITVTITIAEYRELVKENAVYEYKLNKRERELAEVQKAKADLQKELDAVKGLFQGVKGETGEDKNEII